MLRLFNALNHIAARSTLKNPNSNTLFYSLFSTVSAVCALCGQTTKFIRFHCVRATHCASVRLNCERRAAVTHPVSAHLMPFSFDSFATQIINAGNVRNEFVEMKINVHGINSGRTASTGHSVDDYFFFVMYECGWTIGW